ncbi:DUF1120 domain-containing protein [Ewingella americana]|uniref:DUF1120 domain-containing protein n=1 Tax=Ewingella americana TaxID=41202 RepID=UPI0012ADC1F1|nr:DUF1120 domain-containing protein [Ewingella americana]
MKPYQCALLAISACLIQPAVAAPSSTVKIQGTVTTGACTPSLSNGGIIDLGERALEALGDGVNVVSVQRMTLTVTCSSPTRIAYTLTDNRHGSLPDALPEGIANTAPLFGLGKSAQGINIGSWFVRIPSATAPSVDGVAGDSITSTNGTTWYPQDNTALYNTNEGKPEYASFADKETLTPATATTFSTHLEISAALSSELRTISERATVDGSASINIVYL